MAAVKYNNNNHKLSLALVVVFLACGHFGVKAEKQQELKGNSLKLSSSYLG
jgi:hypothetical protein